MTNPFAFIVGCPRSGTTLLQRMVDAHPQIAIVPEIGWLASRYEERKGLTPEGMVTSQFLSDLRSLGRYTPLPVSTRDIESVIASGSAVSYANLITWLFDAQGKVKGKHFVGSKSVDHVRALRTLHGLWPRAKLVHLIRDGRDVGLSAIHWRKAAKLANVFGTWKEAPVSTAAVWWEWQVRLAREAGNSLGEKVYYEMRYESLVRRPAETCQALCEFLGVPYDEAMLNFHRSRPKSDPDLDAKHAWLPPTPGLRDWNSQMPGPDVERFEAVAGKLLDELGYPRATRRPRAGSMEHAARIRRLFEGRPLPRAWTAAHNEVSRCRGVS